MIVGRTIIVYARPCSRSNLIFVVVLNRRQRHCRVVIALSIAIVYRYVDRRVQATFRFDVDPSSLFSLCSLRLDVERTKIVIIADLI